MPVTHTSSVCGFESSVSCTDIENSLTFHAMRALAPILAVQS